ncbi:MAG: transporter substrate-binding domain-containing protein [Proteobacteria bacterium]|nr:transporter substrate-binding domain-containing protein [Pseudomonadota bacterium]
MLIASVNHVKFIFSHLGIILITLILSGENCCAQQQQPLEIKEKSQNVLSNESPLNLSLEETQWLAQHPLIKIAGPKAFPPFNYYSADGMLSGMAADYIRLVFNKLHLKMEIQDNLLWPDVLKMAKGKSIDLITCAARTEERDKYLLFSDPYLSFPLVIITRTTAPFIGGLDDLHGHKVAIVDKVSVYEWLKRDGIDIDPLFVKTPEEALMAVSLGEADAHIENIAAAGHLIQQKGLTNLKIAGPTTYGNYDLFIAVRNDWPELVPLINKALASISHQQRSEIRNKWLTVRYEYGITAKEVVLWILCLSGLFATGLLVFYAWNRSLKKEIVERKRVEKALQSQKSTLDSIFRVAPTGIGLVVNRVIVQANDKLCHITGYAHEELINQNARILYPSTEEFEFVGTEKYRQIAEKDTGTVETHWQRKDKTIIDVLLSSTPVKIGDLSQGVTFTALDITANKCVENELIRSAERYKGIVEDQTEFICRFGIDGQITFANRAICRFMGKTNEEIVGGLFTQLLPNTGSHSFLEILDKLTPDTPVYTYEHIGLRQAGKEYRGIWTFRGIFNNGGQLVEIQAVGRDVTQRKILEEKLRQSHKMEAIGALAGGVAHDLNNILTGIVSYPDLLLLSMPPDSPYRKAILTIQASGKKAAAIVQDLLTLARRGVAVKDAANLNTLISEYLLTPEHKKLMSSRSAINVNLDLAADLQNIEGSPFHLTKAIMNLVANGAEAIAENGTITIRTENRTISETTSDNNNLMAGDYAVLTISDTGVGIPPNNLDRIFEPFFTNKKMGRSGTGLGLAVVWGTVQDHNGYIKIESLEGKGTTFTLYFPVTKQEMSEVNHPSTVRDYIGNGQSILIVDDMSSQREIAMELLTNLNYIVKSASSGEEAVDYLKENSVDLLVLDMIMAPGIDGLETYKRILDFKPHQKAIITSGYSETNRVKGALKAGVKAYLRKPYSLEELGVTIKKALAP